MAHIVHLIINSVIINGRKRDWMNHDENAGDFDREMEEERCTWSHTSRDVTPNAGGGR